MQITHFDLLPLQLKDENAELSFYTIVAVHSGEP